MMTFLQYLKMILLGGFCSMAFVGHAENYELMNQQDSSTLDLIQSFTLLKNNRETNKIYNDSLFMIKDYDEWASFLKRRVVKNRQMFQENKQLVDQIESYLHGSDIISVDEYLEFFDVFYHRFALREINDPFTLQTACQILEKGAKDLPDSLNCINAVSAWKLYNYLQMWNLGGDVEYLKKAYACGQFVFSDEAKKYPHYDYALSQVLRYMPKTVWLVFHIQTIPEYRACCRRLDDFLNRPNIDHVITPKLKKELLNIQQTADEALVRNTYLAGDDSMGKQEADSLMKVVVERNLKNPNLSELSYVRTLYMQMSLRQITAKEAWQKSLQRYHAVWGKIKGKHLDARQLNAFLQPFYTFFYINYKAEIPWEDKRKMVLMMSQNIMEAYLNRKDYQNTTDYVRDLLSLSTYNKLTMYLTPAEVERFLNVMNVATQVSTYAHSTHVAKITDELVKGIFKYHPEMMVGILGNEKVKDVMRNKKNLMNFAHDAAMYHDLGKNSIATLVKNNRKSVYPDEIKLVERHPEFADKYLSLTPGLMKYKDVAFGHHKWYDGKGGYPANFDNTKSPIRIMIDIVALSDYIQLATENLSDSQGNLAMDTLMNELRLGAGTQFNPDLVNLIDTHEDIKAKLAWLLNEGWTQTYYGVYKMYFEKSFSMRFDG